MSGVKELSGLHGPSFITSDIHFSSWAGYIPCLQLFLAGISQLCLLQNLRVLTVTQVSFSHFTQGPLTAASPFWAVTQGFPPSLATWPQWLSETTEQESTAPSLFRLSRL